MHHDLARTVPCPRGVDPPVVQLWHATAQVDCGGDVERYCESSLVELELRDAERFRRATTRNQHVIGRGMARRLLAGDRVDPKSITFETLPHGKPIVRAPEIACRPFNISHTEGLVVCGITESANLWIGVDVESKERRTDPALAERYFSPPEIEYLRRTRGAAARREVFLRIWTLKEAFIKAIGTGLRTPLADFAFEEPEADSPELRWLRTESSLERRWQFRLLEPRRGYFAAVAIGSADADPPQPMQVETHCFDDRVADVGG